MERRITASEVGHSLEELLQIPTMTIATRGIDGEPHAAAVYFVCDEKLRFFFFSDGQSQHSLDIAGDERAAITVHPQASTWQEIHGLQARGAVSLIHNQVDWQHAWEGYAEKFPFVRQLEAIVSANEMYIFTPHWIRLVDNRRGFGFKQEWSRETEPDDRNLWIKSGNSGKSAGSANG